MKLVYKLLLGFLTVVFLSTVTGLLSVKYCKDLLENSYLERTELLSYEILDRIERNIYHKILLFRDYSHSKSVQNALARSNQDFKKMKNMQTFIDKKNEEWVSAPKDEITPFMKDILKNDLSRELKDSIDYYEQEYGYKVFGEVFLTNQFGANIAQTGKTSDYNQSDENWWREAKKEGIYVSDLSFDDSANSNSISIGIRIDDIHGSFIGVLKVVLDMQDIIKIIDESNLANNFNGQSNLKFHLTTASNKLIYSNDKSYWDDLLNNPLGLTSLLQRNKHHKNIEIVHINEYDNSGYEDVLITAVPSRGYKDFNYLNWHLILEQDAVNFYAPINELKRRIYVTSIVVIIMSMLIGIAISLLISKRFKKLRKTAEKIGRGELDVTIDNKSNDEIGILSNTINKMAQDLKKITVSRDRLTKEVNDRKIAEENSQKHLKHINMLRFIDMTITASLDLKITLNILTIQIMSNMGVDAISILLLNNKTQKLEFAAGKGFKTEALRHTNLPLGKGYAGCAAEEMQIKHIPDLKEETDTLKDSELFTQEEFISYLCVPLISKGKIKGVMELFNRSKKTTNKEWIELIENIANQAAIAIDNSTLYDELVNAYDSTIEGWSHAMDLRDKETEGHTQRVAEMTVRIAHMFGLKDEEIVHIRRGSLLHDMGKMGIPDSILLKSDKLTDEEWKIMKCHPEYAKAMLYPIEYLRPALDIPYCHHERWDGTGYPRGLKGEDIPIAARIFAVADVWDALISNRPYRIAWSVGQVINHIRSLSGTHFDPRVVEVFLNMLEVVPENTTPDSYKKIYQNN